MVIFRAIYQISDIATTLQDFAILRFLILSNFAANKMKTMATDNWVSDPAHSELSFKIRHLMISNVSGAFREIKVTADTLNDDFSSAHITLTAAIKSLSTENEQRDKHLLSADFFDEANYPELKFVSTYIEQLDKNEFNLSGDLTMKGVTRPVTLQVEFGGLISDERHGTKAGFTITGKLNRSDWGINFNRVLDTGGVGLEEEVKIFSDLQMLKQTQIKSI
jgi:polyisoprenoid-binding protein YceI